MSDGWNHAGRSVRNRVGLGAGLGEQLWSTTLLCGQGPLTWSRASPAVGWGSHGWKILLLLGWITETKQKHNKQTKKPVTGTQRGGRDMWAGDRQSVCVGKGDRI